MYLKQLCIGIMGLCLSACVQTSHDDAANTIASPQRVERDWLSEQHAQLRKRQVANLEYSLDIDLTRSDKYYATIELAFDNRLLSDDLTIDFSQGSVEKVWVDGREADFAYNNFFITLDKSLLKKGPMTVKIQYHHKYSDNGFGLYRYQDLADGLEYVYTHFEPYEANKLYPHFDQPNLRANYVVTVTAPESWQVMTSVPESQVVKQGDNKRWYFPRSAKLSSYVFPLHAGPYAVWHDQYQDIPLRLFARQSLAQYIDKDYWFDATKRGFAFFNHYFDFPYPYGKYDQVIVPDFNIGGMENVAAVTYNERVVYRGKPTAREKQSIAGLLLHEMSHMWFGNVVTIDWWSNLWLKESFATYMANLAMEKTKLSQDGWHDFYVNVKQGAYRADSLVTTHPIQMPVSDTKNGVASFDAITYRKGASVLQQLTHYLGEETFRQGVRHYIKKHAYKAAKLPDFMAPLDDLTKEDLSQWTEDWLNTPGTNSVKAEYQCHDGKLSEFVIVQSAAPAHPVLRQHSLNIGLFNLAEQVTLLHEEPVKISGERTAIEALIGKACPDLVYPNYRDWGFVKVLLDQKSHNNLVKAIPKVPDSMLRNMLYQSLWDMVEDRQLGVGQYIDIVAPIAPQERDLAVLSLLLGRLAKAQSYLEMFDSQVFGAKEQYLAKLESLMWSAFEQARPGSDQQKVWFERAVRSSRNKDFLARLVGIMQGKKVQGLLLDQDMRWDILTQLSRMGHQQTHQLLVKEKQQDSSHKGVLAAIAVDASWPDVNTKARWLTEFGKTENRLSAQKQKVAMAHLFPSNQQHLIEDFSQRLLSDLVAFDVYRDQKIISAMVSGMMPQSCNRQTDEQLQATIDANPQLGLIAMKGLKVSLQNNQQCIAISRMN